ncbi:phosphoglycolate phosphatase, partial [Xanthomonas perforans]
GDSATDAAAANAANMPLAMVRYGYLRGFDVQRAGAVTIVDDMRELLALR